MQPAHGPRQLTTGRYQFPALHVSHRVAQLAENLVDRAVVAPAAEEIVDSFPLSMVFGQVSPRRSGPQDPVDHSSSVDGRASGPRGLDKNIRDQLPLIVKLWRRVIKTPPGPMNYLTKSPVRLVTRTGFRTKPSLLAAK